MTDLDRDAHRLRLAHAQAELMSTQIEAFKLLEAAGRYLDATRRAADDEGIDVPHVRALADRCRSLLDRRRVAEIELYELAAEMREQGADIP
jgi:hypothetical protein